MKKLLIHSTVVIDYFQACVAEIDYIKARQASRFEDQLMVILCTREFRMVELKRYERWDSNRDLMKILIRGEA